MKSWFAPLLALALGFAPGCQKRNEGGAAPDGLSVSGVILERLDAQDSSYLRIGTESGEVWAKVPPTDMAEGADVSVVRAQEVHGWESPRLQRTFDCLYIGSLDTQGRAAEAAKGATGAMNAAPQTAPSAPNEMPQGMAQAIRQMADRAGSSASVPLLQRAPGSDGRTVAEILANGPSLKGKTVSVRGQVVRATTGLKVPNVAGGTWAHVQDGTGDPALDTHDLTVATDDDVKVGDVLVLQGKVTMDETGVLGGRVIVQGAKKK